MQELLFYSSAGSGLLRFVGGAAQCVKTRQLSTSLRERSRASLVCGDKPASAAWAWQGLPVFCVRPSTAMFRIPVCCFFQPRGFVRHQNKKQAKEQDCEVVNHDPSLENRTACHRASFLHASGCAAPTGRKKRLRRNCCAGFSTRPWTAMDKMNTTTNEMNRLT